MADWSCSRCGGGSATARLELSARRSSCNGAARRRRRGTGRGGAGRRAIYHGMGCPCRRHVSRTRMHFHPRHANWRNRLVCCLLFCCAWFLTCFSLQVCSFQAHRNHLNLACWDDAGARLYSSSDGRTIAVWELRDKTAKCVGRLRRGFSGKSALLGLDARRGALVASSARGTHHVWTAARSAGAAPARLRRGDGAQMGAPAAAFAPGHLL